MFSLYPKHWSVCHVKVKDRDLIAFASKRAIAVRDCASGDTRVLARTKGPALTMHPVRLEQQTLIASAGVDRCIRLWDPEAGLEVLRFDGHPSKRINAICPLPDSDRDLVVTAGSGGILLITDLRTGQPAQVLSDSGADIQDVCLVRLDGEDRLASVGLDGAVRIWDYGAGTVQTLTDNVRPLHAVTTVTVEGRPLVAAAGEGFAVSLWDPATGEQVRLLSPKATAHTLSAFTRTGGTVYALCPVNTDNGVRLAAGGDFPGVWLWDPATGNGAGWVGWNGSLDKKPLCGWVRDLAVYPNNGAEVIVTCGYDRLVRGFPVTASPSLDVF